MIAPMEANWPESMTRQVKAEPKKAVALAVLVLLLGGMWAKIFLFGDSIPTPAGASVGDKSRIGRTDTSNQQVSPASQILLNWTRKPITGTKRNLFAIKLDYFLVDGTRPIFTGDDGDGFWDQLAKSLAAKADLEKVKGILLENLRLRANRLELQFTVIREGAPPKAMVNGTMVQEGDTIEGFRIVRIEAKRIVVECESVKFEVQFKH
jgi:hypothetical protein